MFVLALSLPFRVRFFEGRPPLIIRRPFHLLQERMLPLKDWISLFEKYRIDRRLYDLYRHEYAELAQSSPRKVALEADLIHLERSIYHAELLLSLYDSTVNSPRDALQKAEERLFLACHYINGLPMESTAAAMGISRDTAYRIRRRVMSRGEISPEILGCAALSDTDPANARDARIRVQTSRAIREACFAGKNNLVVEPPPPGIRSPSTHPTFLFTAK